MYVNMFSNHMAIIVNSEFKRILLTIFRIWDFNWSSHLIVHYS